ncbi:phosphopyruvate hydratase [Arthrobacter sp. A5]|uniref:phosphopyruvate hydratase n=1 Tax=Arthrobacter sp. A5 TaxID=576926 RepID=UPI003DA8FE56
MLSNLDHPSPLTGATTMNELTFTAVHALQILDSRGHPTLRVTLTSRDGAVATASAPSGASTGAHEAIELRDGGPAYAGRGVESAVAGINTVIRELLLSRPWPSQRILDAALCELDGTAEKSRLGANAVVAVSMAAARAFATASGHPLHTWIGHSLGRAERLPVPHFNVLNGGAHAANPLAFQEFMIAPTGAPTLPEAIRWGSEIYHALGAALRHKGLSTGLGDEGGYAPEISRPEEALELITAAISDAGYTPGTGGVSIALDPAANYFYQDGSYELNGRSYTPTQLTGYYEKLISEYPIRSLEDPLAEDDRPGWPELTAALGRRVQVVGDDLFVTNPDRVRTGIAEAAANAVLIKPNQIGTVTETLDTLTVADRGGFTAMVSHRSGETEDTFVADLAVGSGCGQLKSGAPARGERVAKYNRLLEIADAHPAMPYGPGTGPQETAARHD